MKRRLFSLFLALVMCLSLLPTAAFAQDVTDTDGTDGTTLTDTPTTGTDDSTGAPTGKGEDGEDADKDTDSTDSTEGAAEPAPMVGSAPTPVVLSAAPLLGATNQESAHTVQGHKDCGSTTCTGVGSHACGSASVSWQPLTSASDLKDAVTVTTTTTHYYLTKDIAIADTLEITANNVVLCLNGHIITLNKNGPVIEVSSGKTFTLTDCASTSGTITHEEKTGCGVFVKGIFKMYGGSITGNIGDNGGNKGGGVYVSGEGTFNMYGGTITDNKGVYSGDLSYGGGVYIHIDTLGSGGTFNMYGGTIGGTGEDDGNSASYGGGVYMEYATSSERPATFNMYGGTIIGNAAGKEGGGVYVNYEDHFTMTGGSITNNSADSAGGGVYVFSDSITVGGSATITGNKSVGVAYGGKDDNVYLALNTKVSVNSGFSGSVGINVDVDKWKEIPTGATESNGKNWTAVDGDGRSNAVKNNNVTYDNGDFSVNEENGKLNCLHAGGVTKPSGLYCCERCGAEVYAKTEFKNAAGNILKTQYYETASAAFDKAENNCVITLLNPKTISRYTWDLNNKTVTLYADYGFGPLTVKSGTLNLGYTRSGITANYIGEMIVENGATVNVDVYPSGFYGSPSLTVKDGGKVVFKSGNVDDLKVESGGEMEISGGTFGSITVDDGMTCADLLAEGYAFFDSNSSGAVLKKGNVQNLQSMSTLGNKKCYHVKLHPCDFNNQPICDCGRECPHSSIDFATGKCATCNEPLDGILVQKTAGGTTVTGKFATFNAAVDSIETGDTNVTIKLMKDATFEDTDPAAEDDNTTILFPCTIDLNGKKLTVKERYGNNIEECNLTIASTVTITGTDTTTAGTIDTGVSVYVSKADNVVGKLTVTGNVSIPKLWVNSGATVNLKGGTYGNVSGSCTAGDLLAEGYAFQKTDSSGAFAQYSTNIDSFGGTPLTDVKVVECKTHSIGTGGKCNWCGTQFAVARTIGTTTQYFETISAAMAGIESGSTVTITLLADVTEKNGEVNKQIKIEENIYLTLDLNGNTLTANITVPADSTGKLTMSSGGKLDGTLAINGGTVELSGGTFGKITVTGADKTVGGLLKTGYGYQYTTGENNGTWPEGDEQTIQNVSVKKIPIKSVSLSPYGVNCAYGDTGTLTATAKDNEDHAITTGVSYQWYMKQGENGTEAPITDATGSTYTTPNTLAVGKYYISCKATVDGYSVMSGNVSVMVRKITLNIDTYFPTAKTDLVCETGADGAAVAQVLVNAPSMPDDCYLWYRLGETGQFTKTIPTAADQGTYTVYWYSTGNDIYDGAASENDPHELTVTIA